MGEATAISWTNHTFQPWMGCSHVSPGCDNCYAEALGKRTGRVKWGDDAERVMMSEAYWLNPIKWNAAAKKAGRPALVFCASLADVFEDRPELAEPRARLFHLIAETPWLIWQLLTKRPENVRRLWPMWWLFDRWPENVWIGTTVEDQERADERIPKLLEIPARVRFLSCEPLLGPLDLSRWLKIGGIGWIIVGGESGPGHRPLDLDHARDVLHQARAADVPAFFKQVGGRTPTAGGDELDGRRWKDFPPEAQR